MLLGDETAIPAIEQLWVIPASMEVDVHLEVEHPDARLVARPPGSDCGVASRRRYRTTRHLLRRAIAGTTVTGGTRVWAAGEAASMQAIRTHLFDERATPRSYTTIRGYWKVPRS